MSRRVLLLLLTGSILAVVWGCQGEQASGPGSDKDKNPAIPVSLPVEREVTPYEDFNGRIDAVEVVDLKARVQGYLTKLPFKEGAEVHKDDMLFEVDPRPYEAQFKYANLQVELNKASLDLAQKTLDRDLKIADAVSGGVSQLQLDQEKAAVAEALARLEASKANAEIYDLNLKFTKVRSPIDGQVSRYYLTKGNLITQDSTLLTTIVSLDPMFAYFDLDEPSLLRIKTALREGRISQPADGSFPVYMGLQNEADYPHTGKLDFLNNQVNSSTGSISMRGVFANPLLYPPASNKPSVTTTTSMTGLLTTPLGQGSLASLAPLVAVRGTRLLTPGMFVRIRLPIGTPYKALLVVDRAILSDQGLKYVYVVDDNNKVVYRKVKTRMLEPDGLRVVEGYKMTDKGPEGIKPTDRIVSGGLQQVKPNMTITPEPHDMMDMLPSQSGSGDKGTKK